MGRNQGEQATPTLSRRAFLAGSAAVAAGTAGCSNQSSSVTHGWIDVDSPVDGTLYDVVVTQEGPYAVGSNGTVVTREDSTWTPAIENGPAGEANTLYGADVSNGGRQLWYCGSSGAIGSYNTVLDEEGDYSAPDGKTSSWTDVTVAGRAGNERIALLNSSGEYLPGKNRNGTVEWGEVTKPTGGESGTSLDLAGRRVFVADSSGGVFRRAFRARSDNAEQRWTAIGIDDAATELRDLVAFEHDLVVTVGTDGAVYTYDGHAWMADEVAESGLQAVARTGGNSIVAGNGGAIYELADHQWTGAETPTDRTLHGCALGNSSYADVAVGEGGVVLERFG